MNLVSIQWILSVNLIYYILMTFQYRDSYHTPNVICLYVQHRLDEIFSIELFV